MPKVSPSNADDLSEAQRLAFAEWMAKPSPRGRGNGFDEAWDATNARSIRKKELSSLPVGKTTERRRKYLEKHIEILDNKITPAKKQASAIYRQ